MIKKLKESAAKLKNQLLVLHLAYKDFRTPWYAKVLVIVIIAYALSPIDLIPDFIPVIGLLDDLILIPLGIYFALKIVPKEVIEEAKIKAREYKWNKKKSLFGFLIVSGIWLAVAILIWLKFFNDYK